MLGGLRRDKPLGTLGTFGWRRSRSWWYPSAFEPLSHGSRTFHHKTRRAPQSSTRTLENFRAATALAPLQNSPLIGLHFRITTIPTSRNGYRLYSRSSTLPTMAEVKWTGPLVRKTFLDFFAERGHSIGKEPAPTPPRDAPQFAPMSVCAGERHAALRTTARDSSMLRFVSICTSLTSLPRSALVVGRPSQ